MPNSSDPKLFSGSTCVAASVNHDETTGFKADTSELLLCVGVATGVGVGVGVQVTALKPASANPV